MGWSEKYKKSIDCGNPKGFSQRAHCQGKKKKMSEEKKDHEYSMARSELKTVTNAAKRLQKKMGKKGEGNLQAWVQSKITKAADYIDTAADYVTNEETVKKGSLHRWYQDSESKDGKSGWVNVVTGGTCASDEPGEGTPKCVSSAKRASMTKAERLSAQRRKKAADPEQQEKTGAAKPTYVSTDPKKKMKKEEVEIIEGSSIRQGQTSSKKVSYRGATSDVKRDKDGNIPASHYKKEKPNIVSIKRKDIRTDDQKKKHSDAVRKYDNYKKLQAKIFAKDDARKMKKEEVEVTEAKDKPGKGSGKKDACYHKVKSRYSVWPSAYASGALVKCRKVGAANWGNKSESYDFSNWRDDFKALEIETVNLIEPDPIQGGQPIDEKCWVGYTQKGMKKKGKKVVPNCVPVGESKNVHGEIEVPTGDIKKVVAKAVKRIDTDVDGDVEHNDKHKGEYGEFVPTPDGKKFTGTQAFKGPSKTKVRKEEFSDWREELGEDWQKVNKSDKTDGMSQKAVDTYRRENPGSKLKTAVTGDPKPGSKDAKRRKSFCSRSKGQQDMHNIDCSKDPDKAICKARRRWKC